MPSRDVGLGSDWPGLQRPAQDIEHREGDLDGLISLFEALRDDRNGDLLDFSIRSNSLLHLLRDVGRAERRCVTTPKAGEEVDVDHDALACAEWPALVVAAHVGIRPCDKAFGLRRFRCFDPFGRIGLQDLLRNRPNEHPPHCGEKVPSSGRILSAPPKPVDDVLLLDRGGLLVAVCLQHMHHEVIALLVSARLHLAPIRRFRFVLLPQPFEATVENLGGSLVGVDGEARPIKHIRHCDVVVAVKLN
nr:hypothetical protein [Bradyrhizobium sp. Ec3.3]